MGAEALPSQGMSSVQVQYGGRDQAPSMAQPPSVTQAPAGLQAMHGTQQVWAGGAGLGQVQQWPVGAGGSWQQSVAIPVVAQALWVQICHGVLVVSPPQGGKFLRT